jgi:hypothetical protein
MTRKSRHVVLNANGKWSVLRSGAARATGSFDTQKKAVKHARRMSKQEGSDLYVHGKDGSIREHDSYGEPVPLRAKR